jgi:hypothetical protein
MKQKTNLLLVFMLSVCFSGLQAQDAEAVVSAGGDATGPGDSSVSYTVGEAVYTDISAPGAGEVYQGVQQTYEFLIGLAENDYFSLSMSVYPNPTVSAVTLQVDNYSLDDLQYQLYDIKGRIIATVDLTETQTEIPMESLAGGTYYLSVSDSEKSLQTFPIIKNY